MHTMQNRSVVNARQDSFDPRRRMIGFRCTEVKPKPLALSVGVAALAILSLVGTPSPTWGQHEEKAQTHQTHSQTRNKGATKQETRNTQNNRERGGDERGRNAGRGRIDEGHFNRSFGSYHRFYVNENQFNEGFFGYGGFEFGFLEPWPVGWAYDNEVYVDYLDGGYVLVNPMYPGVTIGLTLR